MTKQKLIDLKDLINQKSDNDADLKFKRDEFAEIISAQTVKSTNLTRQIDDLKIELTEEAKNDYIADPNKNKTRDGGLKIQSSISYYYDAIKALAFAKEKDMFLTLDKKAFEKSMKSLNLDFVSSSPVVKVTFPKVIEVKS